MTSAQIKEIDTKIREGLQLTHERLIAEKVKNDESLADSIHGRIVIVRAREMYKLQDFCSHPENYPPGEDNTVYL